MLNFRREENLPDHLSSACPGTRRIWSRSKTIHRRPGPVCDLPVLESRWPMRPIRQRGGKGVLDGQASVSEVESGQSNISGAPDGRLGGAANIDRRQAPASRLRGAIRKFTAASPRPSGCAGKLHQSAADFWPAAAQSNGSDAGRQAPHIVSAASRTRNSSSGLPARL